MELLRQVQQAMGGAQRLAQVRDFRMTEHAQAKGPLGGKGSGTVAWCSSGAFLEEVGQSLTYFDGKSAAWHYEKGYFWPISPDYGRQANFYHWFHLLLADSLPDHKVSLAGPNKLRIEDGFGNLAILEINPTSHLPARLRRSATGSPTVYADWREVDGFKLPHRETILRKEMTPSRGTLSWQLNTGLNCAGLDRKPPGAQEAKERPKLPESTAVTPAQQITEDTAARAVALLKGVQEKLGGTEALLRVRDYERHFRESILLPNGEMSKGPTIVETGCITNELHRKTSRVVKRGGRSVQVDEDIYFDGKQSAWIKRRGRPEKLPSAFALQLQQAQFNYDLFNVVLSDRLPGRELSSPDEQTIQILDESGNRATITVDLSTGLPSKKESRFVGKGGLTAPVVEQFSEWKQVDGILLPSHLVGYRNGLLEREVQVEEWKLNTGAKCSELARPPGMAKATR
jgi:hypothetical protein